MPVSSANRPDLPKHGAAIGPASGEQPSRRTDQPRRREHSRRAAAMCEQFEELVDPVVSEQLAEHLRHDLRHRPALAEVGGEPVVLCAVLIAPAAPFPQRIVERGGATAEGADKRFGQPVGLPQCVGECPGPASGP